MRGESVKNNEYFIVVREFSIYVLVDYSKLVSRMVTKNLRQIHEMILGDIIIKINFIFKILQK